MSRYSYRITVNSLGRGRNRTTLVRSCSLLVTRHRTVGHPPIPSQNFRRRHQLHILDLRALRIERPQAQSDEVAALVVQNAFGDEEGLLGADVVD